MESPTLLYDTHRYGCGYGPRAIGLARGGQTLFVGCKDGSITVIELPEAARRKDSYLPRPLNLSRKIQEQGKKIGVRAICDLDGNWLLLGHDRGGITCVPWKAAAKREAVDPLGEGETEFPGDKDSYLDQAVTYIGWWREEESEILVSFRSGGTHLYAVSTRGGRPRLKKKGDWLPQVKALSSSIRVAADRWVLISESGEVWLAFQEVEGWKPKLFDLWQQSDSGKPRYERPGFVADVAVVESTGSGTPYPREVYLSTDEGIYCLRWEEQGGLSIRGVLLPGAVGMCVTLAHLERKGVEYLWVSDVQGDVHLFYRERGIRSDSPWQRSGLLQEGAQAVRSIATTLAGGRFVVSQACRKDLVQVTVYEDRARSEPARLQLVDVLAWETLPAVGPMEDLQDPRAKDSYLREVHEGQQRNWRDEAILAALFETGAEDPRQLTQFLSDPQVRLAAGILRRISEEGESGRCAAAIALWAQTLTGAVSRRIRERPELQYLGIIKWLRRLGDATAEAPGGTEIDRAIGRNIRDTRKWGLFGATYRSRGKSFDSALWALSRDQTDARQMDRLVYQSLLFRQQVDLHQEHPEPRGPQSPWDIQYLSHREGTVEWDLVAISWSPPGAVQGIELYARKGHEGRWERWEPPAETEPSADEARSVEFSRSIVLGRVAGRVYLLDAPSGGDQGGGSFRIRWLDFAHGRLGKQCEPLALPDIEAEGSAEKEDVYSLTELDRRRAPGIVVAGLKGVGGRSQIAILKIEPGRDLRCLVAQKEGPLKSGLDAAYPEFKSNKRNPVWSVASTPWRGSYRLFIGCGDGQIWDLRLTMFADDRFELADAQRVGRLGAPVQALSLRRLGGRERLTLRVVAGALDGTVVAFQTVRRPAAGERPAEGYATLWAAREESAITRIHLLPDDSHPVDRNRPPRPAMVLVVTRRGQGALFSDRSEVEHPASGPLHRTRIPGEPMGRFDLGPAPVVSALWPRAPDIGTALAPPEALLALATGDGTFLQLSLHYPLHTQAREDCYRQICQLFRERILAQEVEPGYLLRRLESVYAAVPELPMLLARSLLEGTRYSKRDDAFLPKHFRCLRELREEWGRPAAQRRPGAAGACFLECLRTAHSLGDRDLYQEILVRVLKMVNQEIQNAAPDLNPCAEILEVLETTRNARFVWGSEIDVDMRIVLAQELFDGIALLNLGILGKQGDRQDVSRVLRLRVDLVEQLLDFGDLRVAQETLRSANLALLRACEDVRSHQRQHHGGKVREIPWSTLAGYYQAVGDFASRLAHSASGELGEALIHEVARAYALGLLGCPSSILRLTVWLLEADLGEMYQLRIEDEMLLLADLLGDEDPPVEKFKAVAQGRYAEVTHHSADNRKVREEWKPFAFILDQFDRFIGQMSEDAGQVRPWLLVQTCSQKLQEAASEDEEKIPRDYQFRHSLIFWRESLNRLQEEMKNEGDLARELDKLATPRATKGPKRSARSAEAHPGVVLFSSQLAGWCRGEVQRLDQARDRYEIFEPQLTLYKRVFARLENVAVSFPTSAAVQKNLVVGILSHGLLERLAEHLLELWEVAQALDPLRTWEYEDQESPEAKDEDGELPKGNRAKRPDASAEVFAHYLLSLARSAETIPKNLRVLQGLLAGEQEGEESGKSRRVDLLQGMRWTRTGLPAGVTEHEARFLHLALKELDENHRLHSGCSKTPPQVQESEGLFVIESPYSEREESRVLEVFGSPGGIVATFSDRYPDPQRPSHGTGLYLASLAAAMVGWRLSYSLPPPRILEFRLEKRLERDAPA